VQHFGRDVAGAEAGSEPEQPAQSLVFAAQLRQERSGERHRVAFRDDRVVPLQRSGEPLGLLLQREQRGKHRLPQRPRERIAHPVGETHRGDGEQDAPDEDEGVGP